MRLPDAAGQNPETPRESRRDCKRRTKMTMHSPMTRLRTSLLVLGSVLSLVGGAVQAAGNVEEGAKKARFCADCHGPTGNYTHTGTPRLAGQSEAAIVAKIKNFRAGHQIYHPMMAIMTSGLNDQDLADLGAYFAAQKVEPSLKPYTPTH
jgi:cytochrome c553